MVIKKDPETLPDDVVDFVDVYEDINTPQYWIAISEEDLKSTLLVLDGHSTILVYTQDDEDLQWEAIHELGQYEYTPDKIGDGLVVFPHTFYLEFKIRLTDKELDVNANFDGTGVRAITMPLKEVDIINFIDVLTERVEDIFSSGLKKHDDRLDVKEGQPLNIPQDIMDSTISFKLGLVGINLQKMNVEKVTPIDLPDEDIQEEVFEVPETVEEEEPEEEEEEDVEEKKTVVHTEEEKSTPPKGKIPPPKARQSPPPPGGGGSGPPSPSGPPTPNKSASAGPPSPKSSAPAPKAPSPRTSASKEPVEVDAGKKSPTTIPSAPGPSSPKRKKSSSGGPPPTPGNQRSAEKEISSAPSPELSEPDMFSDVDEELGGISEKEEETTGSNLYARGMDTREQASSLRNTHTTWFSRMIPNRAYPLVVKITTEQLKAKKSVTNQKTGEVRSESTDQIDVDTSKDLTIRPEFPGCLVVPAKRVVDSNQDNITAKFHVTPLALGTLESKVLFEQEGEEIHSIDLETKVIKHRISRVSATLGALTGSLPAIFAFMFEQSPGEFMNQRMESIAFLSGLGYLVPLLFSGVFFAIAAGFYFIQKPTSSDKSISFPK